MKIGILIGYLVDILIQTYFFDAVLLPRYSRYKSAIMFYIINVAGLSINYIYINNYSMKVPLVIGIVFFTLWICYRDALWKRILAQTLYWCFMIIAEVIAVPIMAYMFKIDFFEALRSPTYDYRLSIMQAGCFAVLYIMSFFTIRVWNKKPIVPQKKEQWVLIIYLLSQMFSICMLFITILQYKSASVWISVTIITILCISAIFVGTMFLIILKNAKKEQEVILIKQQAEYQLKHYEAIRLQYQQTKKMKHDFNNHIETINSLIERNQINHLSEYACELASKFNEFENVSYCHHPIFDAVLFEKINHANAQGINTTANVVMPAELTISNVDVCSLLSNLMDNAIEACMRKKKEMLISVNVSVKAGFLIILIVNSCLEDTSLSNLQKTSKVDEKNHGMGMQIIREIVKKYDGNVQFQINEGLCTVITTLKI